MQTVFDRRPNTIYEIRAIRVVAEGLQVEFYEVQGGNAVLMPEVVVPYAHLPVALNPALIDAFGQIEASLAPIHEARDGSREMHARRVAELVEADKRVRSANLEIARLEMLAIEKKAALDDMDRELAAKAATQEKADA